jgi:hypothetical protein
MDYNPEDHILTGRHAIGAWVACFTMLATVFGAPAALHRANTVVAHARAAVTGPQLCQRHARPVNTDPIRAVRPS